MSDTNQTAVDDDSSSSALASVTVLYGSITLILLVLYSFVRGRYKRLFNVRDSVPRLNCELAKQEYGAFNWIPGVWKVGDDDLFEQCGFTAVAFIRMLRLGMKLSALGCFIAIWLIPAYYSSPSEREDENGQMVPRSNFNVTDPLDKMSLGHTYKNDPRCIGAVIASYMMSFAAMHLIYKEISWYVKKRHVYLKRKTPENYTVYFSRIPARLRSNNALGDFFRVMFQDDVLEINFVRHIHELEALCAEQKSYMTNLKHNQALHDIKGKQPKHLSLHAHGLVDAVQYYQHKLTDVNVKIKAAAVAHKAEWAQHEQRVAEQDPDALRAPPASTLDAAFVSFRNLRSAATALQTLHHSRPYDVLAHEAPKPKDVYWANTGMNHWRLTVSQILGSALTVTTCLFWTVPVAFIATLQNVDELTKLGPDGCELDESCPLMVATREFEQLESLLAAVAPLALIILNSLLPAILGWFCTLEGHIGQDTLQASLFSKLTLFMIIQTFFVSAIAGSLISDFDSLLDDPVGRIQSILANQLPTQAVTFMSLVFVKASAGLMAELLRVWAIIFALLHWLFAPNLTEEEKTSDYMGFMPLCNPGGLWFAWYFSDVILMFVILFVYSVLSPISSVLMLCVFFLLETVYRNQLIFVYDPSNDAGGKYWTHFVWYVVVSMFIAQLTVLAVLSLNESTVAPLMIPLIIVSILFWRYVSAQHFRVASYLPVVECHDPDAQFEEEGWDYGFVQGAYLQEALKSTSEEEEGKEVGVVEDADGQNGQNGEDVGGAGVGFEGSNGAREESGGQEEGGKQVAEKEVGQDGLSPVPVKFQHHVDLVLIPPHNTQQQQPQQQAASGLGDQQERVAAVEHAEAPGVGSRAISLDAVPPTVEAKPTLAQQPSSAPVQPPPSSVVPLKQSNGDHAAPLSEMPKAADEERPVVDEGRANEGTREWAEQAASMSEVPLKLQAEASIPAAHYERSAASLAGFPSKHNMTSRQTSREATPAVDGDLVTPLAEAPDGSLLCCASATHLVFADLRGRRGAAKVFQTELPADCEVEAATFNVEQPEVFVRMRSGVLVYELTTKSFRPAAEHELAGIPPEAWLPPVRPVSVVKDKVLRELAVGGEGESEP